MFDRLEIFQKAQAMAFHAGARQSAIARNIANADTPGYRPADVKPFAEAWRDVNNDFAPRQTRASHFLAGGTGTMVAEVVAAPTEGASAPNGNGVSLESEMVKSAEVRHQHDMALAIYGSALGILRAGLGRSR